MTEGLEIVLAEAINPADDVTAEAVDFLARWVLKQIPPPPLSIIAACSRALWWASQYWPPRSEVEPEEGGGD